MPLESQTKYYGNIQPQIVPPTQPQKEKKQITRREPRKISWTKFEKSLMSIMSFLVFGLAILTVNSGFEVNSVNREVQDVKQEITQVSVKNENLEQKVQELSRYDRVLEIAESAGLLMNEQNVRNVQK
ncbi:cell division protein FtsL [Lacticigenium naphthae]|uniref:cell division protein FtsL n=1 Tax=Lacticigenium naphthae TaxID=515351 RepID=UPI000417552F|nr:cell division protein FtsL [Lacticigenium naphthae]